MILQFLKSLNIEYARIGLFHNTYIFLLLLRSNIFCKNLSKYYFVLCLYIYRVYRVS